MIIKPSGNHESVDHMPEIFIPEDTIDEVKKQVFIGAAQNTTKYTIVSICTYLTGPVGGIISSLLVGPLFNKKIEKIVRENT
jgi:hypothetical protein